MNRIERMEAVLREALNPVNLQIEDDSAKHVGHAGAQPEGETHYRIYLVSPFFEGQSRVARHRKINTLLAREFTQGLHALNIRALTPEEAQA